MLHTHRLFAFISWVNLAFKEWVPLTEANPNERQGSDKLHPRRSGSEPYTCLTAPPLRQSWRQLNRQSYQTVYKAATEMPAFSYDLIRMSSEYFFHLVFFLTVGKKL